MSDPSSLIDTFLRTAENDDPAQANAIKALDDAGREQLAGVLGRFDLRDRDALSRKEQVTAGTVLARLRKIETPSLELFNKVLDYLDLNANAKLEAHEVKLTMEVLDAFAGIESDNRVYSERELELLLAVLRNTDQNNSGRLDSDERMKLRTRLEDPRRFWAQEQMDNPLVKELLAR